MGKEKEPSMNEDIQKYPCYMYYKVDNLGTMMKADWIENTKSYNHYVYELHIILYLEELEKIAPLFIKELNICKD